MIFPAQTYAQPAKLDPIPGVVDHYAQRGVTLARDAASVAVAALRRDAYEMRARGGRANLEAADAQEALARSIYESLR